jgi:hypothetical protein
MVGQMDARPVLSTRKGNAPHVRGKAASAQIHRSRPLSPVTSRIGTAKARGWRRDSVYRILSGCDCEHQLRTKMIKASINQPVSPALGAGGQEFESPRPDHKPFPFNPHLRSTCPAIPPVDINPGRFCDAIGQQDGFAPRKGFADPLCTAQATGQLTESPLSRGTISGYFPVRPPEFAAHVTLDSAGGTVSLTPASTPFRFTSREQLEVWLRLNTCPEEVSCE